MTGVICASDIRVARAPAVAGVCQGAAEARGRAGLVAAGILAGQQVTHAHLFGEQAAEAVGLARDVGAAEGMSGGVAGHVAA